MEEEFLLIQKLETTSTVFLKNMVRLSFGANNGDFKGG